MSRQVFASLVKEKLGVDHGDSPLTPPAPRRKKPTLNRRRHTWPWRWAFFLLGLALGWAAHGFLHP